MHVVIMKGKRLRQRVEQFYRTNRRSGEGEMGMREWVDPKMPKFLHPLSFDYSAFS